MARSAVAERSSGRSSVPGHVSLDVYNVAGRKVRSLVDESMVPGAHMWRWDGRDDAGQQVASGIYLYKMVSGTFEQTRNVVLVK